MNRPDWRDDYEYDLSAENELVNNMNLYIGIDNGLNGGLAAISAHHGVIIDKLTMPTRKLGKGNEVDALAILGWIHKLTAGSDSGITALLETPGKHSPGVMALCSMWDSYGAIRSILETRGIRHHRITPQSWQKIMLPGCEKGDTKPSALRKAKQLWPDEQWLATPRCKTPHDGMIDAALIAEYGRLKNL